MGGGAGKLHPVGLLWCLLIGMAIMCHARNHALLPGNTDGMRVEGLGRLLKASSLDDYNDPSANQGHDPRTKISTGTAGSAKKNRGSPDTP